ncbi:MAG: DUF192 domain-containing protein [Alphaproteobacteria bacterium]|nr:DUF192 domain-containing protein [Alphaproteobacteria bacterium]
MRFAVLAFVTLLAACVELAAAAPKPPGQLPVERVVIETAHGPQTFNMEVAADDNAREYGLMHRTNLPRSAGMLFDFRSVQLVSFWMKDTPLPLDIIFVRPDGTIANIAANAVPYSTKPLYSAEPIRAVLEINGGLSKQLGIAPGDHVRASIFAKR